MSISRFLPLCALLVSAAAVSAAPPAFERFSGGLRGLDGRFEQVVYDDRGEVQETSSGTVALSLPRLFRWEVEQPFPQLIVADGNHVWIFDPDLEQVTVRKQALEEQSSPLALIMDYEALEREFVVEAQSSSDDIQWIKLTPRAQDAAFSEARLGFRDGELQQMNLLDNLGQRSEVTFSDWKRNPTFANGTFRFVPEPGIDVVGEMIDEPEVFPISE